MYKIVMLICVLFIISLSISFSGARAEENIREIDIETSPHKVFFNIKNSKPGDSYTEVLKVQNNGSQDFKYLFSNRFLAGSEKFYNELVLTVTDVKGELYKGKIKDFHKLDSRKLRNKTEEELTLSVYVPDELGNEYQGQNSEFQFKFYVEGTLGGVLPADGPKLPNTGSDMFNILVAGAALIVTGSTIQFFLKRRNKLEKQV